MQTTNGLYKRKDLLSVGAVRAAAAIKAALRWQSALTGVVLSISLAAEVASAQRPATDNSVTVSMAVEEHFASLRDYQPGDLVTRSQVAAALAKVADARGDVPNAKQILAASVPDNSFLARELSTPAGRKFMRKVARHPGAFS
ncbi:MAG TPA: hypothetical protein VGK58_02990, partial [Lacipirellulaceae bacterium]